MIPLRAASSLFSPDLRLLPRRALAFALRDTNVVVASVIFNNLLRALSSVILTRLLVPEVFGIAGLIGALAFTLSLMSDLGFQAFVVRHQDGDKARFLDTVWTVALIRSALLTLLLIAMSGPIAVMIGSPELAPIIAASSLIFVVEGVASVSLLTAIRHRKILRLSLLEASVAIFQFVAAAILAYFWRNYWAILASLLMGGALKSLLSYLCFSDSLRRLALDRQYLKDLWGFARFVTGSSIITVVLVQSDKFVLAALMPLEAFGLYVLAGNLASAPLAFASAYASRVLYPAPNPTAAEKLALIAVGGYGRGVLAPYSDLDLLFLRPWKTTARTESVTEFVLYVLWDLGVRVGQATRSVDECLKLARNDMTVRTTLLEARPLAGDHHRGGSRRP